MTHEPSRKPVKPHCAYLLYRNERLMEGGGDIGLSSKIMRDWKEMTESEMEPYHQRAKKLMAQYNREMEAWRLAEKEAEKPREMRERKEKVTIDDAYIPNTYVLFCRERCQDIKEGESRTEQYREMWRNITPEEKVKLQERYQQLSQAYNQNKCPTKELSKPKTKVKKESRESESSGKVKNTERKEQYLPNPYVLFCRERCKDIKEGSDKTKTEQYLEMWRNITPEENRQLLERYQRLNQEFSENPVKVEYESEENSNTKKKQKCKSRQSNPIREEGQTNSPRPKRPPNAYGLYSREQFKVLPKGTKNIQGVVHDSWERLSEAERAPYYERFAELLEEFHQKLEEWNARHQESDAFSPGDLPNPYMIYRKELLEQSERPATNMYMLNRWNSLSAGQRSGYYERYEEQMKAYEQELRKGDSIQTNKPEKNGASLSSPLSTQAKDLQELHPQQPFDPFRSSQKASQTEHAKPVPSTVEGDCKSKKDASLTMSIE